MNRDYVKCSVCIIMNPAYFKLTVIVIN